MGSGVIEEHLRRIKQGERGHLSSLLPLLSSDLLTTPISQMGTGDDARGAKKIRVVSLTEHGIKKIPTFTADEYCSAWSGDKYQSFTVPGADLALAIPRDAYLVIDPGQAHSIELTPDQVRELARIGFEGLSEGSFTQSEIPPTPENIPLSPEPVLVTIPEEKPKEERSAQDALFRDLSFIFSSYPEIEQAQYLSVPTAYSEGVLGLVTRNLHSDRRFLLMADIAEIARMYFGLAGAIDVYDDISVIPLDTKQLLSELHPFYFRVEQKKNESVEPLFQENLASQLEKIHADLMPGHLSDYGWKEPVSSFKKPQLRHP